MYLKAKTLQRPWWATIDIKIVFFSLAALLLTFFLLYAYLVNKTVMNVVARENAENDISELSTTIGTLESQYMTLKNSVTLDLAYSRGFKDATPSQFISRGPATLSYNSR